MDITAKSSFNMITFEFRWEIVVQMFFLGMVQGTPKTPSVPGFKNDFLAAPNSFRDTSSVEVN